MGIKRTGIQKKIPSICHCPVSIQHSQIYTHEHLSYYFCVIVICVGAEIALLDKSILGPLDGHCGSRERS